MIAKRTARWLNFIGFAGLLFVAAPAQADTDYRCLNLCVNTGKPASRCLPQCTYQAAPTLTTHSSAAAPEGYLLKNRVFQPLNAVAPEKLVKNAPHKAPGATTTNYQCLAACLHDKMQYDMCSRRCTEGLAKNQQK